MPKNFIMQGNHPITEAIQQIDKIVENMVPGERIVFYQAVVSELQSRQDAIENKRTGG